MPKANNQTPPNASSPLCDDSPECNGIDHEEDGAQHVRLDVKKLLPNRRIDKYLKHRFPDFSRATIQRLIEETAVTVNGRPTKSSHQIRPGDQIDIILPPPQTNEIVPEKIDLNIVYEDDAILVINKQADLIVHPARGNRGGTLVNGLVYYSDSLSTLNGQFRPGIVHRLDRNTTGLIIVAKTDTAHWRLAHQFEHRLVQKTYYAIVHGTMNLDNDVIDAPLGRHPRVREKYAVRPDSGKTAVTRYELVRQYRGFAMLKLSPKTGRTHQLRVHMNMIKHPIVADLMYNGKLVTFGQMADGQSLPALNEPGGQFGPDDYIIERQALHAGEITFHHPTSGLATTFQAPLPRDMEIFLTLLDRYRNI